MYAIFPSAAMIICSIIIIVKIFNRKNKLGNQNESLSKKRLNKNKQISYILLTTNILFFLMVSPLVVMNAMNLIHENTINTTIVYFLSYANHG